VVEGCERKFTDPSLAPSLPPSFPPSLPLGRSRTGTGKTLAFGLPICEVVAKNLEAEGRKNERGRYVVQREGGREGRREGGKGNACPHATFHARVLNLPSLPPSLLPSP